MIGLGIDTVDVERFRHSLRRTPSLAQRLFAPAELAYAAERRDPTERLAARFAAKEAAMKALGVGIGAFGFHDVTVDVAESGRPALVVVGRAGALGDELGVVRWHLSLTHTALVATAIVLAE